MRVFGVIGWKNSGKTHLMVRLITEFTARGLTVSTVKHAHHSLALGTRDRNGHERLSPDAHEAIFASPEGWTLARESTDRIDTPLSALLDRIEPVDLILIEGFKLEGHPKLEAFRHANGRELLAHRDPSIVAVAADTGLENVAQPVFDLDDTRAIADFILDHVGWPGRRTGPDVQTTGAPKP